MTPKLFHQGPGFPTCTLSFVLINPDPCSFQIGAPGCSGARDEDLQEAEKGEEEQDEEGQGHQEGKGRSRRKEGERKILR